MAEVAGLGLGVKKFRLVWVFTTEQAFDDFVNKGWDLRLRYPPKPKRHQVRQEHSPSGPAFTSTRSPTPD